MSKRPKTDEIAAAIIAAGATAEQGAEGAAAIASLLAQSPDANAFLTEFNNAIEQRWNDTHSSATIYDRFKNTTNAPTLQAVVYERIAPIDFDFNTDIDNLNNDEQTETRKIPKIHSILKTLNLKQRFKTSSSALELSKMAVGQDVTVNNIVENMGASYADDRTERFISLVDGIEGNKTKDEINAMADLANVSLFIQTLRYYGFKFKEKRTDIYNNFTLPNDATAKSDTKMRAEDKPVCFIDPQKLYKIEGDYYSTLYQLKEALPEVDFVEIDGLSKKKFAILCDPRVVEWSQFYFEINTEQMRGRPSGEFNHYLFSEEKMGSYNCFNRVIFKTAE